MKCTYSSVIFKRFFFFKIRKPLNAINNSCESVFLNVLYGQNCGPGSWKGSGSVRDPDLSLYYGFDCSYKQTRHLTQIGIFDRSLSLKGIHIRSFLLKGIQIRIDPDIDFDPYFDPDWLDWGILTDLKLHGDQIFFTMHMITY